MVFKKDLPDLYFAFHDRLKEDGKEEKIIKCKICCLEVPAYSTRAEVCEMCFDVDFWEHQKEENKKRTDIMWAIKVTKSGLMSSCCYHAKGHYWIRDITDCTASLGRAKLYATKDEALCALDEIEKLKSIHKTDTQLPEFRIVQIQLTEI